MIEKSGMKKKEIIELLISKGRTKEEISKIGVKILRKMLDEEVIGDNSLKAISTLLIGKDTPSEVDDILLGIEGITVGPSASLIEKPISEKKLRKAAKEMVKDPLYEEQKDPPLPSSPEWTQYVLSLFQDDELDGENPRVEGLRRVASQLLLGIQEEGCDLISSPSPDNAFRACAKAWVIFGNGQRFEALADAAPENCTSDFTIYPVAMADTRAKGRCYRAALMLKRVIAAEEKCGDIGQSNSQQNIHTGQLTAIDLLSTRLKVDPIKLIKELFPGRDIKSSKSLNHTEAQEVIKELNRLRNETK